MALRTAAWREGRILPRIDLRLLLGVLLVAVALVGGVRYAQSLRITEPVLVAARTIPAGELITAGDLAVSEARLEGALSGLALTEGEAQAVVGRTAGQTIHAGALVLRPDLTAAPALGPDEAVVTVPVAADSVFGQLRRGDRVAVLGTSEPGQVGSETQVLLDHVTVYAVASEASHVSLGDEAQGGGRITNVSVVVPRAEAERVTHALVNGRITLALVAPAATEASGSVTR